MFVRKRSSLYHQVFKADSSFSNPMTDAYVDIYGGADLEREKNRLMFNQNKVKRNKRMIRRYHLEDLALQIRRFAFQIKLIVHYDKVVKHLTSNTE